MKTKTYPSGEFIPRIEPAHDKIHELEALLGRRPSDLSDLMNIDSANEEIERLEAELDQRLPKSSKPAMALVAKEAARTLEQTLTAKPTARLSHGFKAGSGIAKLAIAIERTKR